jgi:hypothetical protein
VLTRLVISRLSSGTVIDVPVHVLRPPSPAPPLLLMAVMHGDEVNGIETTGGWRGDSAGAAVGSVIAILSSTSTAF